MIDATIIDLTEPERSTLELVDELVRLERPRWRERQAGIPAWHPRNEEADDDAADDDADDDDAAKAKAGDDDDKDADDDSELGKARAAAAAANRELRKIKADAKEAETKAAKEAGKYKDLYEEAQAELDKLKGEVTTAAKSRLVEAALTTLQAKNPARAARLIDLDNIEDATDAERAAKRLKKEDGYLFNEPKSRQKKGAGETDDDDDDEADKKPKRHVSRIRRGLEATAPK